MQMMRTTVSLPVDLHEELREEAFRTRRSISDVLVQKVRTKQKNQKNIDNFMRDLDKIAKENDRQNHGISFSEKLIEMHYEQ